MSESPHSARRVAAVRRALTLALLVLAPTLGGLASVDAASAETFGKLPALESGDPRGLVGASAVYARGASYVLGGRLASGEYSADILKLDHATGRTSVVAQLPTILGASGAGRQSGTAAALGDKIYYFGGAAIVEADVDGDGRAEQVPRAIPDIVEFDPATERATRFSASLPAGAWGMSSVSTFDGSGTPVVYLFGGFSFDITRPDEIQRRDWVLRFVPAPPAGQSAVTEHSTLPYAVQDAATAVIGNRAYIFGGLSDNDNETNPCPVSRVYNSETDSYEERPLSVCTTDRIIAIDVSVGVPRAYSGTLPYRAQFVHAAVYRGKAYMPGARLSDGTASSTILEFSPTASPPVRELAPTLPEGVFGAPVTIDGEGYLYVFGGRLGGLAELTDSIVRITPRATPPTAPRALTTTPITGGVRLAWEPPAYDGDSPVTAYRVYRSTTGVNETRIGETNTLAYEDTAARPGTSYVYRVTAVNSAGESALGASTARATDATTPGAVQGFSAYGGNGEVLLRWSAPLETGGANLTGYRIYRDGNLLRTVPPTTTEHRDTDVENGARYSYVVRAVNVKGDGAPSPTLAATPAPVPDAPLNIRASTEPEAVRLEWAAATTDVTKYIVYRGESPGDLVAISEPTETLFLDASIVRGKTYFYAVAAVNPVGASPPSDLARVALVSKPGAPQSVFAAPLEGAIRLTWQPPENTGEAPVESLRYYVSRKDPGADRFRILDTDGDLAATSYVDSRVLPGVEYVYTVTALNPLVSDPSAEVRGAAKQVLNRAPLAFLEAEPLEGEVDVPVRFDASKSTDPDGSISAYEFDFGDGSEVVNSTSPQVSHAFGRDGFFSVRLRVWDNRGDASEPATLTIKVGTPGEVPDSGGDNRPPPPPPPPGDTPKIPGPGLGLVLLVALAVAVGRRR